MKLKAAQVTRDKILRVAYDEMYRHGYQGSSLNSIVSKAGITKGALFHHFRDKNDLGLKVIEEQIKPKVHEIWTSKLDQCKNPIDALLDIIKDIKDRSKNDPTFAECGCSLNNLAMEMSPLNEGFRIKLESIFEIWRHSIRDALSDGVKNDIVRQNIDTEKTAAFIVASVSGCINVIKNAKSSGVSDACFIGLFEYLEGLRA